MGSGEKHRRYVEKIYIISIKSLVIFGTLTYLIRYVRVPVDLVMSLTSLKRSYHNVEIALFINPH